MKKPTLCGKNRVYLPESGCGDCAEFDYRIGQLERWKDQLVTVTYQLESNDNAVTLVGSDSTRSTVNVSATISCD